MYKILYNLDTNYYVNIMAWQACFLETCKLDIIVIFALKFVHIKNVSV